jgi:phenylpyruvate tautomerase PptA (4-oxalocrotonate tautomerase family)
MTMPVLDVEVVVQPDEILPGDLAGRIAAGAGEVFGAAPGTTWVKLHRLPAADYAENGTEPDAGVHPVFVTVLKARLPEPAALQVEVTALTQVIAAACGRPPENVHVLYQPAGAGRVAFGGRLVSAQAGYASSTNRTGSPLECGRVDPGVI